MLFAAVVGLTLADVAVKPRIDSVSLFKNGYAVVMRSLDVPNPGAYVIEKIPQASLGTLWFSATEGTELASVETTSSEQSGSRPIENLDEVLRANVGKKIIVRYSSSDSKQLELAGNLLSASGQVVVIKADTTQVLPKSSIYHVLGANGDLVYTTETKTTKKGLRLTTKGKGGKIYLVSLERGMTWSPGYAIDLTDKKNLRVTAKSTVLNDLEDISGAEVRFVTGFPNVPFATAMEPLTSGASVDQFVAMLNGIGVQNMPATRGGFGGGGMMTQNAAFAGREISYGDAMPTSPVEGQQVEDLFFYRQPDVNLGPGQRAFYTLFRANAEYKEVYSWDVAEQTTPQNQYNGYRPGQPNMDPTEEVWHTLQFKNTAGQPFTTGAASVFKNGQIIGQDTVKYVSSGSTAELKISKALDVHPESDEQEVSRERGAIRRPADNYPVWDLVTLKGTLKITNMKNESVHTRVTKEITGEVAETTMEPVVTKTSKGLRSMNSSAKIVWNSDIDAGKSITLTYSYKIYVPSQN